MKKNDFPLFRIFLITLVFTVLFGGTLAYILLQKKTADDADANNHAANTNIQQGSETAPGSNSAAGSGNGTHTATSVPTSEQSHPDNQTPAAAPASAQSSETRPAPADDLASDISSTPTVSPTSGPEVTSFPEENISSAEDGVFSESSTVTLCLTGDLMCLAGQQYAAEKADGSHDYSGSFSLIQPLLADCDIVFGNLETVLSESNPYTTQQSQVNDSPNCNAPADYLASLKWAGFTGFVTANNHCLDGGVTGIAETITHLNQYEFAHTGTYQKDETSDRFLLFDCSGIRIAILSFTELINQRTLLSAAELEQYIDCYSKDLAAARIAQAKAAGAEYIIVYIHWGSENTHDVREYQRTHARELADAGADLIIGSHPHCLQEQEMIVSGDGRTVPCFYSLGNLVSSMVRDINNDTVLLFVTLKQQEKGIELDTLSLIPCHVFGYLEGSSHVIVPCSYPAEKENTAEELSDALERISSITGFSELLQ